MINSFFFTTHPLEFVKAWITHQSWCFQKKKSSSSSRAQLFGSPFLLLLEIDSQSKLFVFLGKSTGNWVSKNTRVEWQVERSKVKNMTGQDSITLPWTTRPSPLGKIRFYKDVETLHRDWAIFCWVDSSLYCHSLWKLFIKTVEHKKKAVKCHWCDLSCFCPLQYCEV